MFIFEVIETNLTKSALQSGKYLPEGCMCKKHFGYIIVDGKF
jgi:hypothetical protein